MIDLRHNFAHLHWRPMPHSFGVPVASDWADKSANDAVFGLYKRCGLWTMDEAQILHQCALQVGGSWVDIGSHTGWTTSHILSADREIVAAAVDPMLAVEEFLERLLVNCQEFSMRLTPYEHTADEFFHKFAHEWPKFSGVCVDGDHSWGKPLDDAKNAIARLAERGVILFHDCTGGPVQEAVEYCVSQDMRCKSYPTVHGVAVCWRGDFVPPNHAMDMRCAPVINHLGPLRAYL